VHVPPAAPVSARARSKDALNALRREEILAAAIKLFGRKGFDATRAEDIAVAAKIAKGTLYLYFKNKDAIYAAAVAQAIRALQQEIERRSACSPGFRDRLATAIRVRLEFWPEHEAIYRLLLTVGREPRLRRQTNEVLQTAHEGLMGIFAQGEAAGEIEAGNYVPLGWALLDLIRGATERRMDKLSATTPQEDAAWITACVMAQVRFVSG
jgi:AcrR family transcriptional regulator